MKKNFALIAAALLLNAGTAYANDNGKKDGNKIPTVKFNSGLLVQSERAGTPNSVSGYIFAPLLQGDNGDIFFLDGNTNFDAYLNGINTNAVTEITGSPEVFRF